VEQFHRDGFLNAGRILDHDQLDELSSDLDRVIAQGPDGFAADEPRPVSFRDLNAKGDGVTATPVWQIVNIWEAAQSFERLVRHPAIVTGISQLTGCGDLQVWHDQVQYKPAAIGGATGWHQDAPAWPTLEPMTQVSAWIPFDDAGLDNGCMWMVPGSYRWGNQRAYFSSRPQEKGPQTLEEFPRIGEDFTPPEAVGPVAIKPQPCPVRRGEVHFHHALTWHGSPANSSPRRRRAVAIHYLTGAARYTGRGQHLMERFLDLQPGAPMAAAGAHFPIVCRGGVPVGAAPSRSPVRRPPDANP
jgi:ectoine hydroxylase-related dioxygenase (phytanoyl-CoA dioxygenase family)